MKNQLFLSLALSLFIIPLNFAQVPGWVADPAHVSFKYFDGMYEQEWSHWITGSIEFWSNNAYDAGSQLNPQFLKIYDPDQLAGLDIESLVFQKSYGGPFEELVRLDYNGLNFVNTGSWPAADLFISGAGGQLDLFSGGSNNYIVRLGSTVTNSGQGNLRLYGPNGSHRQYHAVTGDNMGYSYWYGANGNKNVYAGAFTGTLDLGVVQIYDGADVAQAGMRINAFGQGEVWGDLKTFRSDYPGREDTEIVYASLEGPEAGAYERGTSRLENGEIFVSLSDHYKVIANTNTMTVILTPHEWDTYGLAVTEKTPEGFKVKELKGGKGSFNFDWEVKCVRNGFEDFPVLRETITENISRIPLEEKEEPYQKRNTQRHEFVNKLHSAHEGCVLKK